MRKLVLVCAIALTVCSAASCAELTRLDPRMVAVFKNGLGFFVRTGEANLVNSWGVTDFVPQATLGTFWMSTPKPGAWVDQSIVYFEDVEKQRDARTLNDLLKANEGKYVRIERQDGQRVGGKLVSVSEGGSDSLIYLETAPGVTSALPKQVIRSMELEEGSGKSITYTQQEKRLKFKVEKGGDSVPVTLAYLTRNITWVPSYLVNIEDEAKARITFQAELANDIEDVENVDVVFVVGYPNFAFSNQTSPMALQQQVQEVVRGIVAGQPMRADYLSNVAVQSTGYAYGGFAAAPSVDSGYGFAPGTPAQVEEDLFLYEKQGVTLKKGQRAAYAIFSALVDYEHIYEWNVEDTSGVDPWGQRSHNANNTDTVKNPVWHSLRLTNSTDYPWTTGPALTVSGNKPLAQDTINYTPKGAKGNLKMTIASDAVAEKQEQEVNREHNVLLNGSHFDLVTVDGILTVTNYKTKAIKLMVTKDMTGEVVQANKDGKVKKTTIRLTGVNPHSTIEWEVNLPAGESVEFNYRYKVYVRM